MQLLDFIQFFFYPSHIFLFTHFVFKNRISLCNANNITSFVECCRCVSGCLDVHQCVLSNDRREANVDICRQLYYSGARTAEVNDFLFSSNILFILLVRFTHMNGIHWTNAIIHRYHSPSKDHLYITKNKTRTLRPHRIENYHLLPSQTTGGWKKLQWICQCVCVEVLLCEFFFNKT